MSSSIKPRIVKAIDTVLDAAFDIDFIPRSQLDAIAAGILPVAGTLNAATWAIVQTIKWSVRTPWPSSYTLAWESSTASIQHVRAIYLLYQGLSIRQSTPNVCVSPLILRTYRAGGRVIHLNAHTGHPWEFQTEAPATPPAV